VELTVCGVTDQQSLFMDRGQEKSVTKLVLDPVCSPLVVGLLSTTTPSQARERLARSGEESM
jgi:hypothetical protein